MSIKKLPTYKAWTHHITSQLTQIRADIDGVMNIVSGSVGAIWGDRTLANGNKAFTKFNNVVKIKGNLYEVTTRSLKPLKLKKGFFFKKVDFLDSPTAWVVRESDPIYSDKNTRISDFD